MKNVLILSYHFPPMNNIAARRYGQMVQYFAENGWTPWIITTNATGDLPVDIPESQIIRLGHNLQNMMSEAVTTAKPSLVSRLVSKVMPTITDWGLKPLTLDRTEQWAKQIEDSSADIRDRLPQIDAIVSSFGPSGAFAAGAYLKELLGVPAILEFRDMAGFLDKNKHPLTKQFDRYREKKYVQRYDRLLTVSPTLQTILQDNYHKSTDVIYNGWKPVIGLPATHVSEPYIYFAGRIYDHQLPSMQLLLKVLAEEKVQLKLKVRSLSVDWINDAFMKMVQELGLEQKVCLFPPCSAKQAQQEAAQACVNLILEDLDRRNPWSKGTLTGKLMQLMPLPAPILSIAREDNDMGPILQSTGKGQLCESHDAVTEFLKSTGTSPSQVDLESLYPFSKQAQAQNLCHILDELTQS